MAPVPTAVLWAMEFEEEGNEPVGRSHNTSQSPVLRNMGAGSPLPQWRISFAMLRTMHCE